MEYLDKEGIKTLWSKITGKLGDYLPLSGGTMKDNSTITAKNLTLSQGVNEYLYLGNTAGFTILKGSILGDNDILPKWTIDGETMTAKWFNGCASSTGVNSLKVYAENSNQINFGGTGTDTTIVFGNNSKDDRAVPTTYKFGANGTAKLLGSADMLDGYHETKFFRHRGAANSTSIIFPPTSSDLANITGIGSYVVQHSGHSSHLLNFNCEDGSTQYIQFLADFGNRLLFRSSTDSNLGQPWKKIAFTDSNVASATKLANSRALWGRSFNGTNNIYGNMLLSDSGQYQENLGMSYSYEQYMNGFIGFSYGGSEIIFGWGEYTGNQDSVDISPLSETTCSISASGIKYKGVDVYHKNNFSTAPVATQSANGLMTATDKKKLDALPDVSSMTSGENIMDYMLAYGVEWTLGQDNPEITRIGNTNMHRTLPIQSQMKGCIVQNGNKVMYYLTDGWKARTVPVQVTCNTFTIEKMIDNKVLIQFPTSIQTDFLDKQNTIDYYWILSSGSRTGYSAHLGLYENIESDSVIYGKIISIHTSVGTTNDGIVIQFDSDINLNNIGFDTSSIYIGSNLSGYDGEVKIEIPQFGIKSYIVNNGVTDKARVFISPSYIDNSYTTQKKSYLSAYKVTVLNTVPSNMGYLSTLPQNSAISVMNGNTYCRGGDNRENYDTYGDSDIFRTDLGKPRTNLDRATMRGYARLSNNEILNYIQYKNIFYWLYVIEYANFNCQAVYNSALTSDGYHQGGMGTGITNMVNWPDYNSYCSIIPCGYGNKIGNGTGLVNVLIPQFTYTNTDGGTSTQAAQTLKMPRWRGIDVLFGDVYINLDGIIIQGDTAGNPKKVYITNNPDNYGDTTTFLQKMILAGYEIHADGNIKEFHLGNEAHIFPSQVGGDSTKGKCDYHYTSSKDTSLRALRVGGCAYNGSTAGVGCFYSDRSVSNSQPNLGFYTIKEAE